ncbi:hypothetical protein B0H63DRAFT_132854 [Podospora didyma]|uniref:Zn(2)-C6 fungal-type domain-containing protein n=1 Tax=Podospora didyma TaxID=330526 RepID=A0AAE0P0K6_9PEZI|nr:hypothetical protein B0H63DRAFT_132854 [Podospora didyma]
MVGVPTSKGCIICLTRGVKCDEARPSCSQCRRGQRACPGYAREMKFVDEGPRLQRLARSAAAAAAPGATSARHSARASSGAPAHVVAMIHIGEHGLERRSGTALQTPAGRAPHLERFNAPKEHCGQAVAVFISNMFPLGTASVQSTFLGSWLWHVPPRLGRHAFLDGAALSLALAYFARLSRDQLVLCRAELSYSAALKSLAKVVADPSGRLSSEVLCAVLLLGYFETFVDRGHAWIQHAGGAAHLMRLRGPRQCYDSTFDYSMFLSCRGAMVYCGSSRFRGALLPGCR